MLAGARTSAPGIPLRSRFARPRPPYAARRGTVGSVGFAGAPFGSPLESGMLAGARTSAPGIPLRSRFARPRPPYAARRGTVVSGCGV